MAAYAPIMAVAAATARGVCLDIQGHRPALLDVSGSTVSVMPSERWVLWLDLTSGDERARVDLGDALAPLGATSELWVAHSRGGEGARARTYAAFDARDAAPRWHATVEAALTASCFERHVVVLARVNERPTAVILDAATGERTASVILGMKTAPDPAFVGDRAKTPIVAVGRALLALDLAGGRVAWRAPVPFPEERAWTRGGGDEALLVSSEERREGYWTRLVSLAADTGAATTVDLPGERTAHASSGWTLTLETASVGRSPGVTLLAPGLPEARLAVDAESADVAPGLGAAVASGVLAIVRAPDGAALWTRVPLPACWRPRVRCSSTHVVVLCDRRLLILRAADVPPAERASLIAPVRTAAGPDRAPAVVTFVGASSLAVTQHPTYGRVNVTMPEGGPRLAKGDRIELDEVVVLPGNVVKVARWHLEGGSTAPLADLALAVEALPPLASSPPPPPLLAPLVPQLEAAFGQPLPLLHRLATACDASDVDRDRLFSLVPELAQPHVGPPEALDVLAEDHADEKVAQKLQKALDRHRYTALFQDRRYGLITDPESGARGVAEYLDDDEDPSLTYYAPDFDGWLGRRLGEGEARTCALLLEAVGLPGEFVVREPARAPRWFRGV